MGSVWSWIKRAGAQALRLLRSATRVLSITGVIFALVGIWWLGPHWTWAGYRPLAELSVRILVSVLVLLVPLSAWVLTLRSRYQHLQQERQQGLAVQADACLPYLQAQSRALDRSLQNLLEHVNGRRALYKLPWYLMLGEKSAGKSSLITHSNQRFGLTQATQSARRTMAADLAYPIDWWISDEAVLIDPPGELIAQAKQTQDTCSVNTDAVHDRGLSALDARLWLQLLKWLTQHRSQRALDGIVLVIDVVDLLQRSNDRRDELAHRLRARLYELGRESGARLPLYVVLSKVDLLDGFEELFALLPAAVRDEVMGFSFSLNAVTDFDAWLHELAQHLDRFVAVLAEQTLDALSMPQQPLTRQRLVSMLGALSGVRPTLCHFFGEMLGSDHFTTPALVRGVFLSSVLQQGQTHNAFVQAAAKRNHLDEPVTDSKPRGGSLVYFAQQMVQQAIYPEAGLAGDNVKVARTKRRLLVASSCVASLGLLLGAGGWQHYFAVNQDKARAVLAKGEEFSNSAVDMGEDITGRNLLGPLDRIRDAVLVFGDYRQAWPGIADIGLYQGRIIGPPLDDAYLNLLSRRFLPALAGSALDAMQKAPAGSNDQIAALRVYRMIEDRQSRRPQIVMDWMARRWQSAYPGQGQVQDALMKHLSYALDYADAELPDRQDQIVLVQQALRRIPLPQRVYLSLKEHASEQLHSGLDLRNEIGPAFDVVYRSAGRLNDEINNYGDFMLPAFLTHAGYKAFVAEHSDAMTDLAMVDQWALNERQQIDYSEADRSALVERLRNLYSTDYIDTWRHVLNEIEVTDFQDLNHAVSVLEHVTGPAAPMRRMLEVVRDNSDFYPPSSLSKALDTAAFNGPGENSQTLAIKRAFAGLANMVRSEKDKATYYDETLAAIAAVYDYTKAVNDSADSGKAALVQVLARFSLTGPDPIGTLQRISSGLPEPLNEQVRKLADQTAQVLVIEALQELEKRWDTEVYSFYQQRLAGRYPFSASGSDASLEDFEAFFGPKGRLQSFHDQYLNVFIRDNLKALYAADRGGYLIRPDVLEQLQAAETIRETFFNNQGALGVQFSLEPLGLSGGKRSSVLGLDGQLIPYSHGPGARVGLIWPNTLGEGLGSKLTLVHAAGNSTSLGFNGPWSLFRLLSQAELNGRTDTSVDLGFRITDGTMRYRITAEKAFNPFTQKPFSGFSLPRTLLADAKP